MSDTNVNQCDACDSAFTETYGDEFWEATDAARRVFRSGWNAGRKEVLEPPSLARRCPPCHGDCRQGRDCPARVGLSRATRERLEREERRSMGED